MKEKQLKVGDIITFEEMFFTRPIRWWERIYYRTKGRLQDFKFWLKCKYQQCRYGYSDYECWNFHFACIAWCLPRLKQYRKNFNSTPSQFTMPGDIRDAEDQLYFEFFYEDVKSKTSVQQWEEILDKIIWSMENVDNEPSPIYPEKYDHRWIIVEANHTDGFGYTPADIRRPDYQPVYEHRRKVQEGFELFGKYFSNIWD